MNSSERDAMREALNKLYKCFKNVIVSLYQEQCLKNYKLYTNYIIHFYRSYQVLQQYTCVFQTLFQIGKDQF